MQSHISLIYNKIKQLLGFKSKPKHQLGYYYYEQIFNRYKKKESYLEIIHQLEQQKSKKTDADIKLYNTISDFNVSPKEVIAKFGKPNFKAIQKRKKITTDILLYRRYLGKHKTKIELHFYKKKLAYFCYRLSYLDEKETKEIQHILHEKYLGSKKIDFDNNYIIDRHDNVIQLYRDGDLLIRYISTSNALFTDLKSNQEKQEKLSKKTEAINLKMLKNKL